MTNFIVEHALRRAAVCLASKGAVLFWRLLRNASHSLGKDFVPLTLTIFRRRNARKDLIFVKEEMEIQCRVTGFACPTEPSRRVHRVCVSVR